MGKWKHYKGLLIDDQTFDVAIKVSPVENRLIGRAKSYEMAKRVASATIRLIRCQRELLRLTSPDKNWPLVPDSEEVPDPSKKAVKRGSRRNQSEKRLHLLNGAQSEAASAANKEPPYDD